MPYVMTQTGRPYRGTMDLRGLGSQQSAQQAVGYASTGTSAAVSGAVLAGLIPASVIPFVGPAVAIAAMAAQILIKNSGCGQTCIQTSEWANKAAAALQQNLDAWRALPVKTKSSQALALQTFDQIWNQLVTMCSDPQWGNAGKRCISDRQQGACKWKNGNDCWNWFIGYRDPIANDPGVVPDPTVLDEASSAVNSIFGTSGSSSSLLPLLLIGGLIAWGVSS